MSKPLYPKSPLSCPICGSTDARVVYPDTLGDRLPLFTYNFENDATNKSYRIVACRQCSHQYASPRPLNLYRYYGTDTVDDHYLRISSQRLATAKKLVSLLKKFKSSGRLLDVGCATGDFLEIAKHDFDVEGLELSPWASRVAIQRGHHVHRCTIDQLAPPQKYDVITLWGVIEHFEAPAKEIESLSKLLLPGGIIAIWTPDVSSIMAKVLRRRWWNFQGQHIQFFTKTSVLRLFEDHQLERIHHGIYPYVMTLESLQNSLARYPLINKLTRPILLSPYFRRLSFSLFLPGELIDIYRRSHRQRNRRIDGIAGV